MTPAEILAAYREDLALAGETVTISRVATSGVKARIMRPRAGQLTDTVPQDRPIAIVLAADVTALPTTFDTLTDAAGRVYAIEHVDDWTRRVAGVVIAYELTLAGD